MKRQKGCFNEECISFERKEKYPEEYTFCPKCTQKLQTIFYKGIMPSETGFRFSSGL